MRTLLFSLALLLAPSSLAAQAPATRDAVPCLTTGLSSAAETRDYLVGLMVREDSASATTLAVWKLPRTSPDRVVVVTDPSVCTRVAEAYYADVPGILPEHGIGVVRVGAFTVAIGGLHAGEWRITQVFDAGMRVVARIAN